MNTLILDSDAGLESSGGFFRRNWLFLLIAGFAVSGGVMAVVKISSRGDHGARKAQDVFIPVTVIPPVVIPPPPPPVQIEDPEIEERPDEEQEPDDPGDEVTTNAPEGLAPIQLPPTGGRGKQRRVTLYNPTKDWSLYAHAAASKIADSMRRHPKLKSASMEVIVRIWIDETGRIMRAEFAPTGNAAADAALEEDILKDRQLSGPPPAGMYMPVKLKVTATRPH